jgi:hypothetical protein
MADGEVKILENRIWIRVFKNGKTGSGARFKKNWIADFLEPESSTPLFTRVV